MKKKKEPKAFKDIKICIPVSSGGHLTHMILLKPLYEDKDHFFVTFNKVDAKSQLQNERKYWCHYPTNGNYWNLFRNFFLAWRILRKEKPDLIISCGAGVAIPFFWLGKKIFKCKCVYVEIFDRVDSTTKTGKFCYKYADEFFVQWEDMLKVYPNAKNLGPIF